MATAPPEMFPESLPSVPPASGDGAFPGGDYIPLPSAPAFSTVCPMPLRLCSEDTDDGTSGLPAHPKLHVETLASATSAETLFLSKTTALWGQLFGLPAHPAVVLILLKQCPLSVDSSPSVPVVPQSKDG